MPIENIDTASCYNEHDIQKLLKLIITGKAILFAGAGFSLGAVSLIGENLKVAKELAKEIDKITDEDSDDDLYRASEMLLNLTNL